MNKFLGLVFAAAISVNAWSKESVNCTEPTEHVKRYFGSVSNMEFGESVDFKTVLKSVLLDHAKEIERVVNLESEYSGPDSNYIPRLINLIGEPAGGKYAALCIWGLHREGDHIQTFIENERMISRKGYALFRGDAVIAYFYSEIAVV